MTIPLRPAPKKCAHTINSPNDESFYRVKAYLILRSATKTQTEFVFKNFPVKPKRPNPEQLIVFQDGYSLSYPEDDCPFRSWEP